MSCQSRALEGHCRERGFSCWFKLLLIVTFSLPSHGHQWWVGNSSAARPDRIVPMSSSPWHWSSAHLTVALPAWTSHWASCCSAGEKASNDPTPSVCLSASLGHLDSKRQLLVCWPWLHFPPASLACLHPRGSFPVCLLTVEQLWSKQFTNFQPSLTVSIYHICLDRF